jgi:eukaryotic-like serine/threonine-protein kinase
MSRVGSDDPTTELTPFAAQQTAPRELLAARYEILGLLGQGGMGSVYKARDLELDELVAVKMLRPDAVPTPRALERFRREVKLARRVTHRNVARTFDIGDHQGTKFLTMELVDGEPLSALLAREVKLVPQRATQIVAEICDGLSAAHAASVVHRDLKPENVMLEANGRIVITDFGIARASLGEGVGTVGGTVGTPAYMAPEQLEGAELDGRADLYALGVMLFEMLTGQMPFEAGSPYALAAARLTSPAPDPRVLDAGLPEWLSEVVLKCLARQPADRYASAAEVARALRARVATLPPSESERPPPSTRWRAPDPASTTSPGKKSVAVLPFKNAGAPDDAYLADGLTEDLIDTLSTTPGLKVRPRGTVEGLASGSADPRDVGKKLAVQVVVEGTLRRIGDQIRVSARVVSVDDGFQLWAKRFDRPASELLLVSDEVAQSIAEALTLDAQAPGRQAVTDPRAIELYLRARAEFRRLWEAPTRGIQLLEQAHRLAPDDATILASFARARARRWYFEGGSDEGRVARELAQRAIAKAPDRGETWLALGQVRWIECDPVSAARLLRTALSKSPLLADAHELLGELLLEVADLDDGIARLEIALSLDPSLRTRFTIARALGLQGRWDQARARIDLPTEDEHARAAAAAIRARLALWRGDPEAFSPRAEPDPPEALSTVYVNVTTNVLSRRALADADRAFVEEHLARVEEAARFAAFKRQLAAELFCRAEEPKRAQVAVHEAVDLGLVDENWMRHCPALASLRCSTPFTRALEVVAERAERVRRALGEG